ncbi:MAG: DUF2807 domain-containing protein [Rubrivivax sp.]|nr:DUF2807 domain-containing protein [Rubrivivax sp.]
MKRRNAALVCLLLAGLAPLAAAQAVEGRRYQLGAFDAIEISGSAAVRFTQGPEEDVFVEGDEEAQSSVTLEVRGSTLLIRPSGGWKFWKSRRVQIAISARDLRRVSISGAADLVAQQPVQLQRLEVSISGAGLARFDQLRAESLRFQVSGAGDGQMAGSVGALSVAVSGRSEFRGERLLCERAAVAVSGIGDVKVWVTQSLAVAVSGVGTVDYWGTPQVVKRSTSGVARINERGAKPPPP